MRPEWPHRVPDWTRYGPTDNQTVLRALSNDLQTIISKLTLPLGCVRRLDKGASFYLYFWSPDMGSLVAEVTSVNNVYPLDIEDSGMAGQSFSGTSLASIIQVVSAY